ncbi:MAG: hypothetical protein OXJ52_01690 [Oligoflexia bacterium]|nr:hypothetical protein [Oligoflexia bacterium]
MERFLFCIRLSFIFFTFSFVLPIGCIAVASYSCVDDNGRKTVFSYSYSSGIEIDHMSFPPKPPVDWFSTSYEENLSADSDGGSYNIKITNKYARVNYIQDTVITLMEIPGGEIVKESNSLFEKLYRREYQTITRLHGVFPSLTTYQLDLKMKTLVSTGKFLEKPRKIKKIEFHINNRDESGRVIPIKEPMSKTEGNQIFKAYLNKDRYKIIYRCENINSFTGGFFHWLKTILFP